ncbi:putative membrane protein [Candidatus Methanophagaceae archaeon]|nr:putative membrane protein [Methanophagales archaeon]
MRAKEMTMKARKMMVILILSSFFLPLFFLSPAAAQTVDKRIELRCDFPAQMIEAGDTATFELLLVNHGSTATYNLRWWAYREAKNWDIKFEDGDKDVYKVLLPEGSTEGSPKTVTLAVETPGDAKVGESPIHVHIGDGRITLYVKITETHKGEKGTLALTVTDKDGDSIKGATVSVYKWNKFVDYAKTTVEGKIELELGEGEYKAEIVKEGYHAKETEDFKIRIGRKTDIGIISLEQKEFYADVSSKSPSKTSMVGENPLYQIKIKNSGKADDTYRLDIEGLPEDWYCRYKETEEGKEDISELFVGSGEEKTLYLEFVPPYDVEMGEYNFTSLIQSSTGAYELNLTLKVRGSYELGLYSRRLSYEVKRGERASIELTASNAGKGGTITNIKPEISAPKGWTATIYPKEVTSLNPGDSETFTMKITPPGDITPSDYKVTVKIKSDQLEEEEDFRIIVKESSNVALYGVVIIVIVILALAFMFRKYGRR